MTPAEYSAKMKDVVKAAGLEDDHFAEPYSKWVDESTYRIHGAFSPWEVEARRVVADLDKAPESFTLELSSPGGSLIEAQTIYDHVATRHKPENVTTRGLGIVASAATLLFSYGDRRELGPSTQVMVHRPYSGVLVMGSADDIEKASASVVAHLRSSESNYKDIMRHRAANIDSWMDDVDHWFTPEQAIEEGLATGQIEANAPAPDIKAFFDFGAIGRTVALHRAFN